MAAAVVMFDCRVLQAFKCVARLLTSDEAEAVSWSRGQAERGGLLVSQVTIEATADGHAVSTFAVRHFHAGAQDSGWRCWRDGAFVGAASIDELFGSPSGAVA